MEKFYTVTEICRQFKVKEVTIRRWISNGTLKAVKFGKSYRISETDLKRFINSMYAEEKVKDVCMH